MKKLTIIITLILTFVPALVINAKIWAVVEPFAVVPGAIAIIAAYIAAFVYVSEMPGK